MLTGGASPAANGRGLHRAAVLGHPVDHSLSPVLHRAAYRELGLRDWTYERYDVTADRLVGFVTALDDSWRGLSLTMPLKEPAFQVATQVGELADAVGAINTLVRTDAGWAGENTDVQVDPGAAHADDDKQEVCRDRHPAGRLGDPRGDEPPRGRDEHRDERSKRPGRRAEVVVEAVPTRHQPASQQLADEQSGESEQEGWHLSRLATSGASAGVVHRPVPPFPGYGCDERAASSATSADRIASTGAGRPVISRTCSAPWWSSIAVPGTTAQPRSAAAAISALGPSP